MPRSATECHGVPRSATECHGVPRAWPECGTPARTCALEHHGRQDVRGTPCWYSLECQGAAWHSSGECQEVLGLCGTPWGGVALRGPCAALPGASAALRGAPAVLPGAVRYSRECLWRGYFCQRPPSAHICQHSTAIQHSTPSTSLNISQHLSTSCEGHSIA